MPIYEYECTQCAHRTELLQRMDDAPLSVCPQCGGAVERLISAPAFQFKGSGWYVTDYARKDGGSGNGSKPKEGAADAGKAESGKAESGKAESGKSDSPKAASDKAGGGSSSTSSTDG